MAELVGLMLDTLIRAGGGAVAILFARGTFPKNPKNPEQIARLREKYGKFFKYGGGIVIVCALIHLIGQLVKITNRA